MGEQLLKVGGGLGLVIFSLRIIQSTLDDYTSDFFRKLAHLFLNHPVLAISFGFLLSLVCQTSGLSMLILMALLNRSYLSLPQACLMMFGTTLGSTFKFWFHGDLILFAGALLLIGASIGALVYWQRPKVRTIEISLGLGFILLGVELSSSGLIQIFESKALLPYVSALQANYFSEILLLTLIGATATILIQSASAMIVVIIALASHGHLTLEAASALILGANMGAPSTSLILSAGQSPAAKRLAWIHLFSKLMMAGVCLLFFKTFLAVITGFLPEVDSSNTLSTQLAVIHSSYNVLHIALGTLLLPLLLKMGRSVVSDASDTEFWLTSVGVQKLLAQMPERALLTAQRELQELVRGLYEATQVAFRLVQETHLQADLRESLTQNTIRSLHSYEDRLNSLEFVIARLASNQTQLKPPLHTLHFSLERIQKLYRLITILQTLLEQIEHDLHLADQEVELSIFTVLNQLSEEIHKAWDGLFKTLTLPTDHPSKEASIAQGKWIAEHFFEEKQFQSAIRNQRIYFNFISLKNELITELTPHLTRPRSRERKSNSVAESQNLPIQVPER